MKDLPTHYEFTSEQAYDEKDLILNFECHILQVLVPPLLCLHPPAIH